MNQISTSAEMTKQRNSKFSTLLYCHHNLFEILNLTYVFLIGFVKRYARQVAEFFEFVKKKQETSTENNNTQSSPLLLPHNNGGLWMGPEGNHVPGLELPPLEIRKAMSLLTRPSM